MFIDSLPPATGVRLAHQLRHVELDRQRVLGRPGVLLKDVHFPIESLLSTVIQTLDGETVEVGLSGRDGLAPISVAFGSLVSRQMTIVQVAGAAWAMNAASFLNEYENDAALRRHTLRYAEYAFSAAAQFAACNRLHGIEQRYARWILMSDDRVQSDEFRLTQEYSAQMLGVRRSSVNGAAQTLADGGLIVYRRGVVSVRDRVGLAAAACECYAAVNDDLHRLMGYGHLGRTP